MMMKKIENNAVAGTVRTDSPKAWLLAARPKTLTGAAVPVMIGLALAWYDSAFCSHC